ncbi:MAG: MFS transporter [Lachnospiraceae bacterium]|nr:MFS transporter [Lachnospiraceae bacterium]
MLSKIKTNYNHTIYASYIAYIVQAINNNFAPLLFLTFATDYDLSLDKITLITTINFLVQLLVDLISAKAIDKVGYRPALLFGHVCSVLGLVGMAFLPELFSDAYAGLLVAVVLYAIGGGLMEVLVSPVVEACPTEKKEAAMSLLHSFYCWGHVGVVLISTLFFLLFGIESWQIMACIWAIVPFINIFYFSIVPIYPIVGEHEKLSLRGLLKQRVFWLLIVLMVCAGASEQAMSQWASAFAESALKVSKTVGDLAGPCAFAVLMGTARALYGKYSDKLPLMKMMTGSAVLCIGYYLLTALCGHPLFSLIGCAVCGFSVGIFWPGTFSIAANKLPGGGTAMYALMALAGDLGCSSGPTVVGMVANSFEGKLTIGILVAIIFPIVMLLGLARMMGKKGKQE